MLKPISIYFEECEPKWHVPEGVTNHYIFLLVTEGSMVYTINNELIQVKSGETLFIPKGTRRSAYNQLIHKMYVAHFEMEDSEKELPLLNNHDLAHSEISQFVYLKQRFSLLTQHWLRKSKYAAVLCHSILLEMLAIMNEEMDNRIHYDKAFNIVSQIQDYIAKNYRHSITMEDLADYIERTPNYISNIFKQSTGQTITSYIQQIRIAAACDLLINSQMNIGEISDFLGFCEQSYFNKVFKRITGTPPSSYLKEKVRVWK